MADVIEFNEFSIQWWSIRIISATLIRCRFFDLMSLFREKFIPIAFCLTEKYVSETYRFHYNREIVHNFCLTNQNIVSVFYFTSINFFLLFGRPGYWTCTPCSTRCQVNAWKIQMRYPTVKSRVHRQIDILYGSCIKYNRIIYNYLVTEDEIRPLFENYETTSSYSFSMPTHYIKLVCFLYIFVVLCSFYRNS